jgi:hypothetical protein
LLVTSREAGARGDLRFLDERRAPAALRHGARAQAALEQFSGGLIGSWTAPQEVRP